MTVINKDNEIAKMAMLIDGEMLDTVIGVATVATGKERWLELVNDEAQKISHSTLDEIYKCADNMREAELLLCSVTLNMLTTVAGILDYALAMKDIEMIAKGEWSDDSRD